MKAHTNGIPTLSGISPNNQPLSSDALIRQVIHGPLPQEKLFIRPKDGEDTRMLDLSGTTEDKMGFLPGLEASRYAPKSHMEGNGFKPAIAIDPTTGAVVLLKEGERPPMHHAKNYRELEELLSQDTEDLASQSNGGGTYADFMALVKNSDRHLSGDEMEWE